MKTKTKEIALKLILPYPPSINSLYATFRGRRIVSAKGKKFKSDVALLAKLQGARVLENELCVTFRLFRLKRIGDLDNWLKITQDALKGICFEDDKQITKYNFTNRNLVNIWQILMQS